MKINANLIRPGNIIEHNNRQWAVLKTAIVQPGILDNGVRVMIPPFIEAGTRLSLIHI